MAKRKRKMSAREAEVDASFQRVAAVMEAVERFKRGGDVSVITAALRAPYESVKRLKAETVAAHPDKGGTAADFIEKHAVWKEEERQLKERDAAMAKARRERERRSASAKAAWARRKGR